MPGDSFVEAMKTVLGELADLPFLVELPERGPHAAMIGRTAAMITDIGIDLQPAGWRLTDASGHVDVHKHYTGTWPPVCPAKP